MLNPLPRSRHPPDSSPKIIKTSPRGVYYRWWSLPTPRYPEDHTPPIQTSIPYTQPSVTVSPYSDSIAYPEEKETTDHNLAARRYPGGASCVTRCTFGAGARRLIAGAAYEFRAAYLEVARAAGKRVSSRIE